MIREKKDEIDVCLAEFDKEVKRLKERLAKNMREKMENYEGSIKKKLKDTVVQLDELEVMIKKTEIDDQEIIGLNVGGQKFETTARTLKTMVPGYPLKKNVLLPHFFSAVCSTRCGLQKDRNGYFFVDRDPDSIPFILNYLREEGRLQRVIIPENEIMLQKLILETDYYALSHFNAFLRGEIDEDGKRWTMRRDSKIFKGLKAKIGKWIKKELPKKRWKVIYRGSRDGFTAAAFHGRCNNQGETLTVIESSCGHVFGGYVKLSWGQTGNYQIDRDAFLFHLAEHGKAKFWKAMGKPNATNCLYFNAGYGPTFGGNHDLYVCNNMTSNSNYSNIGHSYTVGAGGTIYLSANRNFAVKEIEVFAIRKKSVKEVAGEKVDVDSDSSDEDEEEDEGEEEEE